MSQTPTRQSEPDKTLWWHWRVTEIMTPGLPWLSQGTCCVNGKSVEILPKSTIYYIELVLYLKQRREERSQQVMMTAPELWPLNGPTQIGETNTARNSEPWNSARDRSNIQPFVIPTHSRARTAIREPLFIAHIKHFYIAPLRANSFSTVFHFRAT